LLFAAVPIWSGFVDLMKWGLNALVNLTGSPGLAIILFTIVIKLLLTPLTIKSLMSARAMQNLQPEIRALQKRHGNDRQKLQAEQMRLYQDYGVNPLAGCLPALFQLPIFFGLYQSIDGLTKQADGGFAQGFLWFPSLGAPDPLHILPFVAAFFQLIQTRMSLPTGKYKPTDPQQKMMNQMIQFLPLMVIFSGWAFPAGLVLYWATQSVFGAIQQYFFTGWGALREWLPFLPEVVRWVPRTDEDVDEKALLARGSDDSPRPAAKRGGLWGALNRQLEKAEQQRAATATTEVARPAARQTVATESDQPQPRQRIIVTNTTDNGGAPAAGRRDNRRRGARTVDAASMADDAPPPQRAATPSRIIVTGSSDGQAGGNAAAGAGDGEGAGPTSTGTGPIVPRKNRSRR
jgi:YidC/Oxa1 family membrane protein insertase